MPSSSLITDWVCIATSGQAVDGRVIEPQWLVDAAEQYSRKTYTAMVWPHHPQHGLAEREFTCNLGEVDALKAESDGEKTKLFARIIPNQFLIDANQQGQKLFTSAEFISDFAGSGKEYLFGLAVTDIPASLGTEKIKFVMAGETKDAELGSLETFSLGSLKNNKKSSFWGKLFATQDPPPSTPDNKPDEGEEKTMDELKAMIQQMLDLMKAGEKAATGSGESDTPEIAAEEVATIADEIIAAAEEVAALAGEVAENPEDAVVAEEFSAAKTVLAGVMKKFTVKPGRARPPRRNASERQRPQSTGSAPAPTEMQALSAQLSTLLTTLSATSGTPLPSNAPGGNHKPHEFC